MLFPASRRLALSPKWTRDILWRRARAVPSLDLRFAENKSLVDATTGQNLVTFTRASSGTYVDSQGVIRTATTNEARFDHNPTTGEGLGLLVEESRTNLLLRSEDFSTAWSTSLCSVATNTQIAPDGTLTADTLTDDNGSTGSPFVLQTLTLADSTVYTMSCFIKAGTKSTARVGIRAKDGTVVLASFDLVAGTTSVGNAISSSIQGLSNGWFRCSAVCASATGAVSQRGLIYIDSGSYTADGTGTIFVWGAQLEAGSFPTSYIPTTTATVTRSADVASITGSNFSSRVNTSSGSFLSEVIPFSINNSRIIQMGDGTGNNRHDLAFSSGSVLAFVNTGGATQVNALTTNTASANVLSKVGYAYSLDDFAWTLNAGSIRTDTAGSLPVVNQLGIGQRLDSTGFLNGTLRRLCFWPQRLSNETLQRITQ